MYKQHLSHSDASSTKNKKQKIVSFEPIAKHDIFVGMIHLS